MLSPPGQEQRRSKLLGEAEVVGGCQALQSGWHGGWLVSAWFTTDTSDGLALQRHHHIPTQFLCQGPPILDVIQPVYLPLVLDT